MNEVHPVTWGEATFDLPMTRHLLLDGVWLCRHKVSKPFRISKRKRILLQLRLGKLPRIYNLHKEESARSREHLVDGYIHFLHKKVEIFRTFQKVADLILSI